MSHPATFLPEPLAINDAGNAAGAQTFYGNSGISGYALALINGSVLSISFEPGDSNSTAAVAINSSNQVAGHERFYGVFLWQNGIKTFIHTPSDCCATAMNNGAVIVGYTIFTGSTSAHAFQWNGTLKDLGTLGGPSSAAQGINSLGQIVGSAFTASGGSHAFIVDKGNMTDLNTLIPSNSGWVLTQATGINDSGRIVGNGLYNGNQRAFLLTPVSSQLNLTGIFPNAGGNAGTATVNLIGTGFQSGVQVRLVGSGSDIVGTPAAITASGSALTTNFNLVGAAVGPRNVVLTNPDGTSVQSANAFTVQQGGAPQLSASIVGFNTIHVGRAQEFLISYGNSGNVDALGVHLSVTFPSSVASSLGFGSEVGVVSTGTLGPNTVVTVDLGRVPAGSESLITMFLTASSSQRPFSIQTSIRGH
jgi:probable HAF family extracellular repeat protein